MTLNSKLYGDGLLGGIKPSVTGLMRQRFLMPPFSVLSTREGFWQRRKRAWIALGIESEIGRDEKSGALISKEQFEKHDYLRKRFATGISIFDPVLCELMYRWFSPPGGQVIDPFAGGSVRGIVASVLKRRYWGCDLRREQVDSNYKQAGTILNMPPVVGTPEELTPVQQVDGVWLKRDDLFEFGGVRGGKVRGCLSLLFKSPAAGVVTAGNRHSPQAVIVSALARRLGKECRIHMPQGDETEEIRQTVANGAELIRHRCGYNSVICARAREDAAERGWLEMPFGMECAEAVKATARQVENLPEDIKRMVVVVGSGMSLAGILNGFRELGRKPPKILGVMSGANSEKRLDTYAPKNWREFVTLVPSGEKYDTKVDANVGGVGLDPIYEAKCVRFLEPGDLFWIVGNRNPSAGLRWLCGDALQLLPNAPRADFILSCPPYGDLEQYSNDPKDLSNMDWKGFRQSYAEIIRLACERLKPNRFACFVVANFRGDEGEYRDLVGGTVICFKRAGLKFYNDAVLVNTPGTLPIRAGRAFQGSRKLGKTHQNILVFVKGDPCKAVEGLEKYED